MTYSYKDACEKATDLDAEAVEAVCQGMKRIIPHLREMGYDLKLSRDADGRTVSDNEHLITVGGGLGSIISGLLVMFTEKAHPGANCGTVHGTCMADIMGAARERVFEELGLVAGPK